MLVNLKHKADFIVLSVISCHTYFLVLEARLCIAIMRIRWNDFLKIFNIPLSFILRCVLTAIFLTTSCVCLQPMVRHLYPESSYICLASSADFKREQISCVMSLTYGRNRIGFSTEPGGALPVTYLHTGIFALSPSMRPNTLSKFSALSCRFLCGRCEMVFGRVGIFKSAFSANLFLQGQYLTLDSIFLAVVCLF